MKFYRVELETDKRGQVPYTIFFFGRNKRHAKYLVKDYMLRHCIFTRGALYHEISDTKHRFAGVAIQRDNFQIIWRKSHVS